MFSRKGKNDDQSQSSSRKSGRSSTKGKKPKKKLTASTRSNRSRADSEDDMDPYQTMFARNGNDSGANVMYTQTPPRGGDDASTDGMPQSEEKRRGRKKGGVFGMSLRSQSRSVSPQRSQIPSQITGKGVSFDPSVAPQADSSMGYNNNYTSAAAAAPPPTGASPYANAYQRPSRAPKNRQQPAGDPSALYPDPDMPKRAGNLNEDNRKVRVRPYRCYEEPVYMTEADIYKDMMRPSTSFVFLKSYYPPSTAKRNKKVRVPDQVRQLYGTPEEDGRIGSLRAEVLGCVGLARQKPFTAVYLITGDTAFCADVLNNFRSPMWPSVSTRAAVFPIHHAYAQLYVGVFDVRARKGKDNDVFCGRVVIDLAALRPTTEYDVTFPLRASTFIYDKRQRGVVRLRFSLHWFSERQAVLSYIKTPKWATASPAKHIKQPTIPCAEPKTFRNIAVTLHGQDFPGKYTRPSFRATIRELNLYQQNFRYLAKSFVFDIIFYERPVFSAYLFITGMWCVYFNAVRMVPVFTMGFYIMMFLDNYQHFILKAEATLGYQPVTIPEVFKALFLDGNSIKRKNLNSIMVKKKARRNSFKQDKAPAAAATTTSYFTWSYSNDGGGSAAASAASSASKKGGGGGIDIVNHREFPFGEGEAYPKFSVAEAVAPGTTKAKGKETNTRLAGRLSIYFVPDDNKDANSPTGDAAKKEEEEEEASQESEEEEEDDTTIATVSDSQLGDDCNWDMEPDQEEEEMGPAPEDDKMLNSSKKSGILVGPPQNHDSAAKKKVPPQVHLKKLEANFHKVSKNISVEKIVTIPFNEKLLRTQQNNAENTSLLSTTRAIYQDDFDKALGLEVKTQNPVTKITSTFLGPIMRIIRILIFIVRVTFNLSTWRDPYLSFWILFFQVTILIILYIFPWRAYFFLQTLVLFGPQNIFLKSYITQRAEEKARRKAEEKQQLEQASHHGANSWDGNSAHTQDGPIIGGQGFAQNQYGGRGGADDNSYMDGSAEKDGKKSFFGKFPKFTKAKGEGGGAGSSLMDGEFGSTFSSAFGSSALSQQAQQQAQMYQLKRPAFSTQHNARTAKRGVLPREAVVPYSRFRKERFYDWPPDPTVSRATPIPGLSPEQPIQQQQQQQQQQQSKFTGKIASLIETAKETAMNAKESAMNAKEGATGQQQQQQNSKLPTPDQQKIEELRRRYEAEQQLAQEALLKAGGIGGPPVMYDDNLGYGHPKSQ